MFLIDDVIAGLSLAFLSWRAARALRALADNEMPPVQQFADVNSCRASVPVEPGLKPVSAMKGGHMYSGSDDPDHLAYLRAYLASRADEASGEDRRRILAFQALQGREGSTAAVNTYDNQIFTWGTGWGGLGMLPSVMDRLGDQDVLSRLASCGVWYRGQGEWSIDDGSGNIVTDKRAALEVIRQTPALQNLFIDLAKNPDTRNAVTDAQLETFKAKSGSLPGSETIATQALFNFATHLKHWAPSYMLGAVESAAQAIPGAPSEQRDLLLAPYIVRHFYGRAGNWVPDWRQLQRYVADMRADGLDVTNDPVFLAPNPPGTSHKTAAGCGGAWAKMPEYKTAGGCGNWDFNCANWGTFREADQPEAVVVKVAAGPGSDYESYETEHEQYETGDFVYSEDQGPGPAQQVPQGFEEAVEVFEEPDLWQYQNEFAPEQVEAEASAPAAAFVDLRRAQGPGEAPTTEQVATVKRGVAAAVLAGDHDTITWTQLHVGEYDIVVSNEPISVNGLRLPTSFDDAVVISKHLGLLPITKAISDARFNDPSVKRVFAQPLADATGALYNDPSQVVRYNDRLGPNTGVFTDGYWKELVLSPRLQPSGRGSMAQYGFRDSATHMFEHGGPSNHDKTYKDYSDTPTYVSRQALKNGAEVDLLDELSAGSSLGGPLPAWLVDRLRNGEVGV